jgi:capsular polysaccharide biosynthesis protein/Mrp family chromosome partitioning ATPase
MVVVLAVLVASLTTFFLIRSQPVSYEATTELLVGPSLNDPTPDLNSLRIGAQLMQTYAELVPTRSFLESVNGKLSQKEDTVQLEHAITTRQNTETRVLTITVTHTDPNQAAAIANAIAETLIEISPSKDNTTSLLRAQMSNQSSQVDQIIRNTEINIQQLEAELVELKSVRTQSPAEVQANLDEQNLVIRQLSDERARLSDAVRTLANLYQVLLDTNTNQIEIIQPAWTVVPVNQQSLLRVVSAGIGGLILAIIIIFAAEYFDDRIRFSGDFNKVAGVPVLSTVGRHEHLDGSGTERFITIAQPETPATNSYQEAVAKLLFSIGELTPYTFLVSSVGSRAGDDTAVAAGNLAVAFARAGKQVVLVDGQLHNPILTQIFSAEKREGVSDILAGSSKKLKLVGIDGVPGMRFLPAGLSIEKSSGAMWNSTKISKLVDEVQNEAEIVLVAGSPAPWFAETLTLASQVEATILVARYVEAHGKIVQQVVENLRSMNVKIAGVIFDTNPSPFVVKGDLKVHSEVAPVPAQSAASEQTSKS